MAVKIQTIKEIRFYIAKELKDLYDEREIRVLSDMLIRNATGISKLHFLFDNEYQIATEAAEKIIRFTAELKKGKPVQYVIGETIFFNCIIRVTGATLIPRPETEELVDLMIRENKDYRGSIVDFGTGSGCIAIALAANLPLSKVKGTDISDDAITIARENALLNKVDVSFVRSDIFNPDPDAIGKAGIIVSNPPYVRESEKLLMSRNVLDFEPHLALFVKDSDPLIYYIAILKIAESVLLPAGRLYFEINEQMGIEMTSLLKSFNYSEIQVISDLNNKNRIIKGVKNV